MLIRVSVRAKSLLRSVEPFRACRVSCPPSPVLAFATAELLLMAVACVPLGETWFRSELALSACAAWRPSPLLANAPAAPRDFSAPRSDCAGLTPIVCAI